MAKTPILALQLADIKIEKKIFRRFYFEAPTSLIIQIILKNFQFSLDPFNEFRWTKKIINHWYFKSIPTTSI